MTQNIIKNIILSTFLILLAPINSFCQSLDLLNLNDNIDSELALEEQDDNDFFWINNSLMLNKEEIDNLKIALASFKNNVEYKPANNNKLSDKIIETLKPDSSQSLIYLSSILYLSKNEWVIWLNDNKISSKSNNKENEFYIEKIDNNKVSIIWRLGLTKWKVLTNNIDKKPELDENNQIVNKFSLSSNQTYILTSNKIIEGKISQ